MNIFRRQIEAAPVCLADEATAFVGTVDLERGHNLQRLLNYRDSLSADIAKGMSALSAVNEQIAREQSSRIALDDAELVDAIDAFISRPDLQIAAE